MEAAYVCVIARGNSLLHRCVKDICSVPATRPGKKIPDTQRMPLIPGQLEEADVNAARG